MNKKNQNQESTINTEKQSSVPNDLPDSPRDKEQLEQKEIIIELPDVKDIPGQEFVHVAPLGELADTTIASDDEEGVGLFDDDDEDADLINTETNVSGDEKKALADTTNLSTVDNDNIVRASMNNKDFESDQLNEGSFSDLRSGADLDVPGSELDNANEQIGEEDEENNNYSLGNSDDDSTT